MNIVFVQIYKSKYLKKQMLKFHSKIISLFLLFDYYSSTHIRSHTHTHTHTGQMVPWVTFLVFLSFKYAQSCLSYYRVHLQGTNCYLLKKDLFRLKSQVHQIMITGKYAQQLNSHFILTQLCAVCVCVFYLEFRKDLFTDFFCFAQYLCFCQNLKKKGYPAKKKALKPGALPDVLYGIIDLFSILTYIA